MSVDKRRNLEGRYKDGMEGEAVSISEVWKDVRQYGGQRNGREGR